MGRIHTKVGTVIGYHFTNYKAAYGGNAPWRSTGFVESILTHGARAFLNVGVGNVVQVRHAFQHHGTRCNKKRVLGSHSIPAVIIIDLSGLSTQQGYDSPLHKQVNEPISPDRIVGWFEFDPTMSDKKYLIAISQMTGLG